MESILNISVSCFANYGTPDNPQDVNLLKWLHSAKYADIVKQIRSVDEKNERNKLKSTLPAITPSGIFKYRAADKLIQHSGFIQFDIDFQDNQHISNYDDLKTQLCNIENVAYCGLSVSGKGYWGLIPIQQPERHKQHFKALRNQFQRIGLTIDDKPSNVAALRGYTFDPDAYFNHEAVPFSLLDEPEPRTIERRRFENDTRGDVEALIEKIQAARIDITTGYDNWLKIGFSFSEEFGESGRDYFHAVSQYHSDYNEQETDKQFSHCLKARGSGVTISSFFYLCKEYDLTLKSDRVNHAPEGLSASVANCEAEKSAPYGKNPYTNEIFDERGYPGDWDTVTL